MFLERLSLALEHFPFDDVDTNVFHVKFYCLDVYYHYTFRLPDHSISLIILLKLGSNSRPQ